MESSACMVLVSHQARFDGRAVQPGKPGHDTRRWLVTRSTSRGLYLSAKQPTGWDLPMCLDLVRVPLVCYRSVTGMESFLLEGLHGMHVAARRQPFLREIWARRHELWRWQQNEFGDNFQLDSLPVFLHGGSPEGKICIMGLNPGWSPAFDPLIERVLQQSPDDYLSFHEQFFDQYPRFLEGIPRGSPFWNNLCSKLVAMMPGLDATGDRWSVYRRNCVAQDILPFHSKRGATHPDDLAAPLTLGRLARATLEGLRESPALEVWAFSREGYAALSGVRSSELFGACLEFHVEGCTRTGVHRSARALVATVPRTNGFGPLPVLAVDNALITQPLFPFDEVCCRQANCRPGTTFAAQLREALAML